MAGALTHRKEWRVGKLLTKGVTATVGGVEVSVYRTDGDGYVMDCGGATLPYGSGYAKGCLFTKTGTPTGGLYINNGNSTRAMFVPLCRGTNVEQFEDFFLAASGSLPTPWATADTSAAGSPTLDYTNDGSGGLYVLKLATTAEVENICLYHGDQRVFDASKGFVFETRLKIEPDVTGAGGSLAAGDKIVWGVGSDRADDPDAIAAHALFMLAGANMNIYVETDDATSDNDDNDTTLDYVANTFYTFTIDGRNLAAVKFLVNGVDYTPETMSLAAIALNVQPIFQVAKASATNKDHRMTIDYSYLSCGR